ncbi:plastocyanin/azurin family copper-binding protein [Nitrososphaera sp.]|uniref:cupredoxin domain-containing protein n=1 Tax=Nitrososphaera sp. TaxID=1971748 RepID=UPI00307F73BE
MNSRTAAMVAVAAILVSGLILVSAVGKSAFAQSGKEVEVEIVKGATNKADKSYAPNPVRVQPGTTVEWKNVDSAAHTVTQGDAKKGPTKGGFDSKIMGPKKEFKFTFAKEGTFDYYCQLHPTMVGKVVVDKKAPAAGSGSSMKEKEGGKMDDGKMMAGAKGKMVEIVSGATNKADKSYAPNPIKVKAGETVTWKNVDSAAHTVSSGTASKPTKDFDSKIMGPKKEFSFKFDKKGTYDYYCQLHPTMVGKVVVE